MLNTAIAAARAAGLILKERFALPHQVRSKGLRDLVTEADYLAQDAIVAQIQAAFPEHQILSEEAAGVLGGASTHRWLVDPLDGTTNYARGIPYFSVSIAAEYRGELQIAVVYDPLRELLFQATAGGGSFLNGERLGVSKQDILLNALLDLGWARGQAARQATVRVAAAIGPHIGSVRTMGSAALGLAAVAAGWEEIFYHPELAPWDMAAGALLVREAGGVVTTALGEAWHPFASTCLASNGFLHQAALEHIAPATAGP